MEGKHLTSSALAVSEPTELEERLPESTRLSNAAHDEVRDELHRLLTSPRFSASHRCQTLLTHVVKSTLKGKADQLKERSIGIAVFGRDLAYDTNSDAVVRIAAGEVRKKLAQYYYDPAIQTKVRISLPPGSYVPVFTWTEVPALACEEVVPEVAEPDMLPLRTNFFARRSTRWLLATIVAVLGLSALIGRFHTQAPDAFDQFWSPIISSPSPVLVCVGHRMLAWSEYDSDGTHPANTPPAVVVKSTAQKNRSVMLLSDSITLGNITALLRADHKTFAVRGQAFTRFEDLQKGPAVLMGAFNNNWTMRLMESMRFHFVQEPNGRNQWIADEQTPGKRIGLVQPGRDEYTTEDYAVVARTFDPQTRQPTIILAGVTSTATHAAGDFISTPAYLDDFAKKAPKNWQSKNMELLIVTKNVNGESGPPRVVDSYFW